MITINNLTIPGLGTYTARVLLYQDQYAGTWSSTDHGGQLLGKIRAPALIYAPFRRGMNELVA